MPGTFASTGGTAHFHHGERAGNGASYSYFVRCQDSVGNINPERLHD